MHMGSQRFCFRAKEYQTERNNIIVVNNSRNMKRIHSKRYIPFDQFCISYNFFKLTIDADVGIVIQYSLKNNYVIGFLYPI